MVRPVEASAHNSFYDQMIGAQPVVDSYAEKTGLKFARAGE